MSLIGAGRANWGIVLEQQERRLLVAPQLFDLALNLYGVEAGKSQSARQK